MSTFVGLPGNKLKSSCADLIRASTSLHRPPQGVDAHGSSPWAEGPRVEPGQDEIRCRIPSLGGRQIFPRTARRAGHRRIADKRKNGEWFDLAAADVIFKRRKFM